MSVHQIDGLHVFVHEIHDRLLLFFITEGEQEWGESTRMLGVYRYTTGAADVGSRLDVSVILE